MGIKRDEHGIIIQHNADYPDQADGGDSASRVAMMAMAGSREDQMLVTKFVTDDYKLVRHPFQPIWNDPKNTSRDQLLCFAAGVFYAAKSFGLVYERQTVHNYASKWFINKDLLLPHYRLALYKASMTDAPLFISLLGWPLFFLQLFYNCYIKPKSEQNQLVCMAAILGERIQHWPLILMLINHPDLFQNLREYFCGKPWRDQEEIFYALEKFIVEKVRNG